MRIALLGGDGQVGWELRRALTPLGEVVALERGQRDHRCGDLGRPDSLRRALRRVHPQVIVNAAAYTDVDRAELEPDLAAQINAEGPGVVASVAKALDALLIHYSSDYVFDGGGSHTWREDDPARPINVYGCSKLEGERAVRASRCRHLILRTQWIYAARRRNFLRTVLEAAAERTSLDVVDDRIGAPTGADLVADVTVHALRSRTARTSQTFHIAARGETTWYGYARFAVAEARRIGWRLTLTEEALVPVASSARPAPAARPLNCRLSVERVEGALGLQMPDWRAGVRRAIAELHERAP